ncbi:MAG: DUF3102 domain-containing protein [Magnetococcales bacterium]|nr:DUF3102 domain-containing protein [Magnetococcales bacterium]
MSKEDETITGEIIDQGTDTFGIVTQGYVDRIKDQHTKTFEAILETGRILLEAKKEMPKGSFLDMIHEKLPFSGRTAQRFMAIASDSRISNTTHVSHLPTSWGTLYELTQLSDSQFQEGIEKGIISSKLERSLAKQLKSQLGSRSSSSSNKPLPGSRTINQPQMVTLKLTTIEYRLLQEMYAAAYNTGGVERFIESNLSDEKEKPNPELLMSKFTKRAPSPTIKQPLLEGGAEQ